MELTSIVLVLITLQLKLFFFFHTVISFIVVNTYGILFTSWGNLEDIQPECKELVDGYVPGCAASSASYVKDVNVV